MADCAGDVELGICLFGQLLHQQQPEVTGTSAAKVHSAPIVADQDLHAVMFLGQFHPYLGGIGMFGNIGDGLAAQPVKRRLCAGWKGQPGTNFNGNGS